MKNSRFHPFIYLSIFILLLVIAIAGFMLFEQMSAIDALYFSIVTMATVGYGDIHPQTAIGKLITLIIIIGGVGTFLGVIASITDLFVNRREESVRQQKLNMVTGMFFSEMGNDLLKQFVSFDPQPDALHKILNISPHWGENEFKQAFSALSHHQADVDARRGNLRNLLKGLQERSDLLLRLIENPLIQEHEAFTDLLRALFHLRDELLHRDDLTELIDSDRHHLEGDIIRVYNLMIRAWLDYVRVLRTEYSYLYSLAIRLNPFDPEASAVVKSY